MEWVRGGLGKGEGMGVEGWMSMEWWVGGGMVGIDWILGGEMIWGWE